ncbi:MAG: hypothetical protein QXG38_02225, partial [Candidatus Hadarchaeales archaeon]
DVPARSVVLPTLWVGDKKGERPLSALEFHQMTERAGRRGKDKVGFVLVIPHSPADIRMAEELAKSAPEELFSAFRVQYYQILNLLSGMEMKDALEVVGKSLAVFQTHRRSRKKAEVVERRLKSEFIAKATILRRLGYLDDEWKLTTIGKWAAMVRVERSLLITEALKRGLMENLTAEEMAGWAGAVVAERAPRNLVATVNLKPLAKIAFELDALEKIHGVERSNFGEAFKGGRKSSATMMAGALLRWAEGEMEWAELVRRSSAEEGDLQRGILQAAEVLHQLANLPLPIAEVAEEARIAILREPVGESPVMIETNPYPEKSFQ